MELVPVAAEDVKSVEASRRGRVSLPILQAFIDSGQFMSQVSVEKSRVPSLFAALRAYVTKPEHGMPVRVFLRNGELYLARLDKNADGTPNKDWAKSKKK